MDKSKAARQSVEHKCVCSWWVGCAECSTPARSQRCQVPSHLIAEVVRNQVCDRLELTSECLIFCAGMDCKGRLPKRVLSESTHVEIIKLNVVPNLDTSGNPNTRPYRPHLCKVHIARVLMTKSRRESCRLPTSALVSASCSLTVADSVATASGPFESQSLGLMSP